MDGIDLTRISQLNEALPLSGNEYIPLTQKTGPTELLKTVYTTPDNIADYIIDNRPVIPAGIIAPYIGTVTSPDKVPVGWLLCNGAAVLQNKYKNLYNLIGTTYGTTGSDTFKLPDLRGRVIMGYCDFASFFTPGFGNWPTGSTLTPGQMGGEYYHRLSRDEMPQHNHYFDDPGHTHPVYDPRIGSGEGVRGGDGKGSRKHNIAVPLTNANTISATTNINFQNDGGSMHHNNIQPYIALNYIIKY